MTYTGEYEISTEDSFGSGTETPMRAIRVKTEGVYAIFPVTKEFAESSDEKIRAYLGARLPTILEQDEFDTVWMVD